MNGITEPMDPKTDRELPKLLASAFDQMDPTELFKLAEQAAKVGQQKADFSEAVGVLVRVSTILNLRIRRFKAQPFREWLISKPEILENKPWLLGALERSIKAGHDGDG